MKTWEASVLYKIKLQLGEGAHWHKAWGKFLFVDIKGKKVGTIDPDTKDVIIRDLDKMIGMVAHNSSNKLIVALQGGIEQLDFETGERNLLVEIESSKPDNRCNDGSCDGMGRLWVGTMHTDALKNEGALYCFGDNLKKVIQGTSVSNGICWTKDHQTMYHIDSFEYNIKAYDFDLHTGCITNGHVAIELTGDRDKMPDGMCIDTEGMLWVAIWGGGCVNRYDPLKGELIGTINVGVPNVTSCAFGGKDMKQLLITTAVAGLSEQELKQFPDSGSLFIAQVDTAGLLPNICKLGN
jgi:sugar lactone lactonase YvrE